MAGVGGGATGCAGGVPWANAARGASAASPSVLKRCPFRFKVVDTLARAGQSQYLIPRRRLRLRKVYRPLRCSPMNPVILSGAQRSRRTCILFPSRDT